MVRFPFRKERNTWPKINKLNANSNNEGQGISKNTDPYISILYTDDCLRGLFNRYKKDNLFDNTIFIITGDHHMHELGAENALEIYHVPLIIYSPLLRKNAKFKALVSHHDIAPSIMNLLSGRGFITAPNVCSWMGYGLETNNIANRKFLPFMQNNKEIDACIYGNYFYSGRQLFRFVNGEYCNPVENDSVKMNIESRLDNFRKINSHVSLNQRIFPVKYMLEN